MDGRTCGWTDGKSPHSTGLRPLSGPLPKNGRTRLLLTKYSLKECLQFGQIVNRITLLKLTQDQSVKRYIFVCKLCGHAHTKPVVCHLKQFANQRASFLIYSPNLCQTRQTYLTCLDSNNKATSFTLKILFNHCRFHCLIHI